MAVHLDILCASAKMAFYKKTAGWAGSALEGLPIIHKALGLISSAVCALCGGTVCGSHTEEAEAGRSETRGLALAAQED